MTLRTRVIPCLQLLNDNLVKSVKFKSPCYIGDFANTVRIFNELEVDELCFLSIRASHKKSDPDLDILARVADECFMPLSYGGGIRDFSMAQKIFFIGFEKVVINSYAFEQPEFITRLSEHFGAQSVIGSFDVKKNIWGKYVVYSHSGTKKQNVDPVEWAQQLEDLGAGEILITSMDRDGTWKGFDLDLTKRVTESVSVPVIANGGAGSVSDLGDAVKLGGASAVAVGSMVVFQAKGFGVLVSFPDRAELAGVLI